MHSEFPGQDTGDELKHGHPLKAIVSMLAGVAVFAGMDTLLKVFSQRYPPVEVATLRGVASLPFLVLPSLLTGRARALIPGRLGMHLVRGALMIGVVGGFIYAVRVLSLADAYSIFLAAPLIVTALSVPLLRESVGWRNWVVIVVGLLGVMAMLRPSASSLMTWGALAALLSATCYALSTIALRALAHDEATPTVAFWTLGIMTLSTAAISVPAWVPLRNQDWPLLAAMGVFGALGQYLFTEAFRAAPPAVIAPFEYTALLWGMAIDWTVWGVTPSARVLVGGGIVIASGLYLIWHEGTRQAPADAPHT